MLFLLSKILHFFIWRVMDWSTNEWTDGWTRCFICICRWDCIPDSTMFFQIGAMDPPISLMDTLSGACCWSCSFFIFCTLTMLEPVVGTLAECLEMLPEHDQDNLKHFNLNIITWTRVCCQWFYQQRFTTTRGACKAKIYLFQIFLKVILPTQIIIVPDFFYN